MPNIAAVLKAEISRVARKEARAETEGLRKATASQRSELASLKKRIQELEKQLKAQMRAASRGGVLEASSPASAQSEESSGGLRFRQAGMAANRKRLGLSAADFGLLVGATGQSVYAWEHGKSKPRGKYLAAIASLRGISKREAAGRLATLKSA
ncbi:MAG: hypothetical protein JSR75_19780 [Proteobacteria bacterium]|nr:hypothetical protein [Pseudomonadota bacterium]